MIHILFILFNAPIFFLFISSCGLCYFLFILFVYFHVKPFTFECICLRFIEGDLPFKIEWRMKHKKAHTKMLSLHKRRRKKKSLRAQFPVKCWFPSNVTLFCFVELSRKMIWWCRAFDRCYLWFYSTHFSSNTHKHPHTHTHTIFGSKRNIYIMT